MGSHTGDDQRTEIYQPIQHKPIEQLELIEPAPNLRILNL